MVTVVKLVVTQARVTVLTVLRQITGLVSVWQNVTSTFRSDRCLFKRDSGSSAESLALSVGSQAGRQDGHRDGRPQAGRWTATELRPDLSVSVATRRWPAGGHRAWDSDANGSRAATVRA